MAEIVGTVSGTIALAEFSVKVGKTLFELKKLWDEVQEVPETIQDRMTQIQIFEHLLKDFEIQSSSTLQLLTDSHANLSLSYGQAAVTQLQALVNKLGQNVNSKKRRAKYYGRAKVVLAKDEIRKAEDTLSRACQFLQCSQSLMQSSKINQLLIWTARQPDLEMMLAQITSSSMNSGLELNTTRTVQSFEICDHKSISKTNPSDCTSSTDRLQSPALYEPRSRKQSKKPVYSFRLRLPLWSYSRVWDFGVLKATSGWQMNLTTFNIVPEDSLIFEYACDGNIHGMRQLFDTGLASPFDCTPGGSSVLFEACFGGQLAVVEELVSLYRHQHPTVLGPAWLLHRLRSSHSLNVETLGPLLREGFFDAILDFQGLFYPGFYYYVFGIILANEEVCDCIFNRSHLTPSVPLFGSIVRRVMSSTVDLSDWPAHVIRRPLWPDNIEPNDRIMSLEYINHDDSPIDVVFPPLTLLSMVAGSYGGALVVLARNYDRTENVSGWRSWLKDIVTMSDLGDMSREEEIHPMPWTHPLSGCPRTPLQRMLLGVERGIRNHGYVMVWSMRKGKSMFNKAIRSWAKDLKDCGVDLQKYGKREAKLLEQYWELRSERWYLDNEVHYVEFEGECVLIDPETGPKLKSIQYGEHPEDWSLVWDQDAEEFAGEFWDMLDNQMPRIPGSWVDDDDSLF